MPNRLNHMYGKEVHVHCKSFISVCPLSRYASDIYIFSHWCCLYEISVKILTSIITKFGVGHCPMRTATTHIGHSCACSGGQSLFGLILVNISANQKQFRSATPSQSYQCFALSSLWWRSGYAFNQSPSSHNYSPALLSKIQALVRAFYIMRYIEDAKGWLYFWEVLRCFTK